MNANKRTARIVGVLYIIGTGSGILSLVFGQSVLDGSDYLANIATDENGFILGTLFVLIMGLALAMVPVMVFPVLRKTNETLATGYVVFRGALEGFAYIVIVISWLLLVTLSREYVAAGAPSASHFQTGGTLLLEAGEWTGQILTIVFALGALMFNTLWYQSRLIPRWLSGWGLIGAVITLTAGVLYLFGLGTDALEFVLGVQEMVLALWLIVKGFNTSAIASGAGQTATN